MVYVYLWCVSNHLKQRPSIDIPFHQWEDTELFNFHARYFLIIIINNIFPLHVPKIFKSNHDPGQSNKTKQNKTKKKQNKTIKENKKQKQKQKNHQPNKQTKQKKN